MNSESVQAWCNENGWTEPFFQESRWWAFPPNAVMPVEVPKEIAANNSNRTIIFARSFDEIIAALEEEKAKAQNTYTRDNYGPPIIRTGVNTWLALKSFQPNPGETLFLPLEIEQP